MGITEQEAINYLRLVIDETKKDVDNAFGKWCKEVCEMSIKALEKQIAKKPIGISINEDNMRIANCPICKKLIVQKESPVGCKHCLQALDWGNEDEKEN